MLNPAVIFASFVLILMTAPVTSKGNATQFSAFTSNECQSKHLGAAHSADDAAKLKLVVICIRLNELYSENTIARLVRESGTRNLTAALQSTDYWNTNGVGAVVSDEQSCRYKCAVGFTVSMGSERGKYRRDYLQAALFDPKRTYNPFAPNPTYNPWDRISQLKAADNVQFGGAETLLRNAQTGFLTSFGLGTAVRSITFPPLVQLGDPRQVEFTAVTENEFKELQSFRDAIPFEEGMTVERSIALAETYDWRVAVEALSRSHPIWALAGAFVAILIDPLSWGIAFAIAYFYRARPWYRRLIVAFGVAVFVSLFFSFIVRPNDPTNPRIGALFVAGVTAWTFIAIAATKIISNWNAAISPETHTKSERSDIATTSNVQSKLKIHSSIFSETGATKISETWPVSSTRNPISWFTCLDKDVKIALFLAAIWLVATPGFEFIFRPYQYRYYDIESLLSVTFLPAIVGLAFFWFYRKYVK